MQTQSHEFYSYLRRVHDVDLVSWGHSQAWLPLFVAIALLEGLRKGLQHRPDLIQLGDVVLAPLGLVLQRWLRCPVWAMAHGKDTAFSAPGYRALVLSPARRLDGIICVSDYLRRMLAHKQFPARALHVNPNGIDCRRYEQIPSRDEARRSLAARWQMPLAGRKVLLAVCRLVRKKGIAEFVARILPRIVSEHPDALLVVVGSAGGREGRAERTRILAEADRHGIRHHVFLAGSVGHDDGWLPQVYAAADVFLMPNRHTERDFEGFGIVALEAAVHAVPVVAFAVDGVPEAVRDGHDGILVPADDDAAYARAVSRLLADGEARVDLGRRARAYVRETYDWPVIVDRYTRIVAEHGAADAAEV
jgi:glycosyltransferase involved in cell wall biosynthesis